MHCWKLGKIWPWKSQQREANLCTMAWAQYELGDGEVWPENGSNNYNTIFQLDLFCRRLGKWSEVPSVQAFMALYCNPALCSGPREAAPWRINNDILDDPLLSSPPPFQGEPSRPQSPESLLPPQRINLFPSYYQKPSPTGHTLVELHISPLLLPSHPRGK